MAVAVSFSPIVSRYSRVLVLGSMPGVASLEAGQYYAHPRNIFWRLMEDLFAVPMTAHYADRVSALLNAGIAVWDVLQSCERAGSLDADIVDVGSQVNDFMAFLQDYPDIAYVFFNGHKAEQVFRRQVLTQLPASVISGIRCQRLPSTSPAHAGMSYAEKLQHWQALRLVMKH